MCCEWRRGLFGCYKECKVFTGFAQAPFTRWYYNRVNKGNGKCLALLNKLVKRDFQKILCWVDESKNYIRRVRVRFVAKQSTFSEIFGILCVVSGAGFYLIILESARRFTPGSLAPFRAKREKKEMENALHTIHTFLRHEHIKISEPNRATR